MSGRTVYEIFVLNAHRDSVMNTDEATYYRRPARRFAKHETVNHGPKSTFAAQRTPTRSKATTRFSNAA